MEVGSSTEMGAPGASHLGTGDRGPKTDRSKPRSVPVNARVLIEPINSRMVNSEAPQKTTCSDELRRLAQDVSTTIVAKGSGGFRCPTPSEWRQVTGGV